MYKPPSSAHLMKDLSFKFCNISIGLDESSPFQYTWQNVFFFEIDKIYIYPKTCLDVFYSSGHKKFAKFSKTFHTEFVKFAYLQINPWTYLQTQWTYLQPYRPIYRPYGHTCKPYGSTCKTYGHISTIVIKLLIQWTWTSLNFTYCIPNISKH
jgi:hypothetical protein